MTAVVAWREPLRPPRRRQGPATRARARVGHICSRANTPSVRRSPTERLQHHV